ncbi:hypothetical protein AOC36_03475 [Erysipelothrix larvae]|uniref:LemA family protein n=1 Tax=Erysipelothrix larvae TaxID=1514105 RepID=A0A0X8GZ27_9FIRM|nr:LemA family protein [Erysipelothrix larvae]AMC93069.1 hypothetical protein AOC36_03475 [Erysipelothrix larvae]
MGWLYIVIPLGILSIYIISVFNQIVRYDAKILESFSNIDVALSKRYHVLTQLFDVAKGYAKYERETILDIISLRKGSNLEEKAQAEGQLNHGFERIVALAETYPDLKADRLFKNLQDAAKDAEEHLQAARRLYNSNVTLYNQRIKTFPGLLIASNMKTTHYDLYKAPEFETHNVNLNL